MTKITQVNVTGNFFVLLYQVQMITDHARRESVKKYASVMLDEKRRLLEGRQVVVLDEVK